MDEDNDRSDEKHWIKGSSIRTFSISSVSLVNYISFKLRCDSRFQRAFTAYLGLSQPTLLLWKRNCMHKTHAENDCRDAALWTISKTANLIGPNFHQQLYQFGHTDCQTSGQGDTGRSKCQERSGTSCEKTSERSGLNSTYSNTYLWLHKLLHCCSIIVKISQTSC